MIFKLLLEQMACKLDEIRIKGNPEYHRLTLGPLIKQQKILFTCQIALTQYSSCQNFILVKCVKNFFANQVSKITQSDI